MLAPVTTILLLIVAPFSPYRIDGRGAEFVQEVAPLISSSVLDREVEFQPPVTR